MAALFGDEGRVGIIQKDARSVPEIIFGRKIKNSYKLIDSPEFAGIADFKESYYVTNQP